MTTLILKDDIDSVTFVDDANGIYRLLDGTLQAPPPEAVDVRSPVNPNRIIKRRYTNRTIRFSYMIRENNAVETINASIGRLFRMFERASSNTYLDGDTYQQSFDYTNGNNTGDNGLVLQLLTGNAPARQYYPEDSADYGDTNEDIDDPGIYSFKVIIGAQEIVTPLSVGTRLIGDDKYVMQIDVELECEPYALGPSMLIYQSNGTGIASPPLTYGAYTNNKIYLDASAVPGDAPALTRITTRLQNSLGIVMGRHAGDSCLANCPSYPKKIAGTGDDDLIVGGLRHQTTQQAYRIKVVAVAAGGDTVQYSTNGGSSWSGNIVLQDHNPVDIGTTGMWFMFLNRSGHAVNDEWAFYSGQSYFIPESGAPFNVLDGVNYSIYMSEIGIQFDSFIVNMPKEAKGKYRILVEVDADSVLDRIDLRAVLYYQGFDRDTGNTIDTQGAFFEWVAINAAQTRAIADLGVLDLTPNGLPHRSHPGSNGRVKIGVKARGTQTTNPGGVRTIELTRAMLVPMQDEDAFLWTGWIYDGSGREVYTNYDYDNPYIGEISASSTDKYVQTIYADSADVDLSSIYAVGLDETHIGAPITLIPGVRNTIVVAPTMTWTPGSYTSDFRNCYFHASGATGEIALSIRPRYLFVGW